MQIHDLISEHRGVRFLEEDGDVRFERFFGFPCSKDGFMFEAEGLFFLATDTGRYEAGKWTASIETDRTRAASLFLRTSDGLFSVESRFEIDNETGMLSRKDVLINNDTSSHIVYAALPRIPIHSDTLEVYGQSSGWCAENNGGWRDAAPGTIELHNTMGRSAENTNPYMCIRQKTTGYGVSMHVLPVGNWVMRVKALTGHKTSYNVLESGLSDQCLRLGIEAGERLHLPETLYQFFDGSPDESSERLHMYLHKRFPDIRRPEAVYNTWFFRYDEIIPEDLEKQIIAAKDVGCKYFVVDAGWNGEGTDWENQVGDWTESETSAFYGKLGEFAEHVSSHGLKFGIWVDPERAAGGSRVYREHRDWFMQGDAIIYDLENPEAYEYLYSELTRLVRTYSLSWLKVDSNLRAQNDLTGGNFYRYFCAWNELMDRVVRENPDCVFEGCASGGLRTDIENMLNRFAGHFISDSVNPLETLQMRRNAMHRMLPQYFGTWIAAHQVDFPHVSYFDREFASRRKTLCAADAWFADTLDLSVDFCMKTMLPGLAGFSGDLASFDEGSRKTIRKWIDFYHENAEFFKNALCAAHTGETDINDQRGWSVIQYSQPGFRRMMIFAYRLKNNTPGFCVFPKHIRAGETYEIKTDGEAAGISGGGEIRSQGLMIECPNAFSARVVELEIR